MMNLVGEIAQYAIETDQIIKQLVQQRDDLKRVADGQEQEIKSLRRRIEEGMAENKRLLNDLNAVRFPDMSQAQANSEETH